MRKQWCASLLAVAVLALPSSTASAQLAAGNIAGVVRDTTGAVLPGVTVEASSPALIERVRTVVTDGEGQYKILDLRPGTYSVTFTLVGFGTVKREGIELSAAFTAPVNAELKVGTLEETVTVAGSSPIVDVQNVRTQAVLSNEKLATLPTGKTIGGYVAMTVGMTQASVGVGQDVGGNQGEVASAMMIHGNRQQDQRMMVDGMIYQQAWGYQGGYYRNWMVSQALVQEIVLTTGGLTAESETGGVQMSVVPKDGGNNFAYNFTTSGTTGDLQSNNLSDALRARGLRFGSSTRRIYDIGGSVGGPIQQDKVWFFGTTRYWGASTFATGNYYNATPESLFYTPDLNRPAYKPYWNRDWTGRITWQVASKHKFTFMQSTQYNCNCILSVDANRAPEATVDVINWPTSLTQGTWTYAPTNRLLLQGGATYSYNVLDCRPSTGAPKGAISVRNQSTGYVYGAREGMGLCLGISYMEGPQFNDRAVLSYVTGSHAFKVGLTTYHGRSSQYYTMDPAYQYVFIQPNPAIAPVPQSITYYAAPINANQKVTRIGAFVQDQWTLDRLTLNLGLRFDYLHEWNPAQSKPAGPYTPAIDFAAIDDVPNYKDVSPRMGASYDLFGDGRTALKVSLGHFVQGDSTSIAMANNPQLTISTNASRTWADANRDFVPQASELGPLSNAAFGTVVRTTTWSDASLNGWKTRGYNWQGAVSMSHELWPGVGLAAGYYRTWYGNFTTTDNVLVTAADTSPFCVTAPADARLPGGGGNQVCGLADISPTKFGQISNLVVLASDFGDRTEVFQGIDVEMNARFGSGGFVGGGISTAVTVTDSCDTIVDTLQTRFCEVTNPWEGQTQFKLNGAYPLPLWGLQASAVLQNLAGVPIQANATFVNAQVAPSLGRNLGQCRGAAVCNGTVSVPLLVPNTLFEKRLTQLDVRLTKNLRFGRGRVQVNFDAYNIFNANTVLARNNTYGGTWGQPTAILAGRLFKFGGQFDW
ncbi:MAG: TonB-dependent receptor [Acidimicrobiia bacterium]|nr:TonB-dependent receptor [Acidimicrobiia bacterium]